MEAQDPRVTERANAESLRHGAPVVGKITLAYKVHKGDETLGEEPEFEREGFDRPVHLIKDVAQGKVFLVVGDNEGAKTEDRVTRNGMYSGQGVDVAAAQEDLRKNLEAYGVKGDYKQNAQE